MKVILNSFDLPLLIIEKEDVKSALKQIENLKMDFIFSDYAMPGMTGLDFAYELKEKYPDQKIPLVIVTSWSEREAHVYREIETKGKELGVLRILPKDLEQSKLQNAILEFIRKL
jgi:CheY-like chemotaxis protein